MITNDETSKPVFSSLDINKDKRLIVLNILYNSSVVTTHILNNGMHDRHHENANDNVFCCVYALSMSLALFVLFNIINSLSSSVMFS